MRSSFSIFLQKYIHYIYTYAISHTKIEMKILESQVFKYQLESASQRKSKTKKNNFFFLYHLTLFHSLDVNMSCFYFTKYY